eukprot:CAMPEP_0196656790 /NCGR_PEP_ID=MMETSP1086-20130531/19508_1 /TAXON_ID=77921 /ORGANISM="Cyanoptyche  gloeocystis , Strain SAG4.97" /LENGTH=281 /DNA_ID=CAMNT_0041989663 /DNA_START=81 /DNA_END=926 /DNA_ORIENTATION=+
MNIIANLPMTKKPPKPEWSERKSVAVSEGYKTVFAESKMKRLEGELQKEREKEIFRRKVGYREADLSSAKSGTRVDGRDFSTLPSREYDRRNGDSSSKFTRDSFNSPTVAPAPSVIPLLDAVQSVLRAGKSSQPMKPAPISSTAAPDAKYMWLKEEQSVLGDSTGSYENKSDSELRATLERLKRMAETLTQIADEMKTSETSTRAPCFDYDWPKFNFEPPAISLPSFFERPSWPQNVVFDISQDTTASFDFGSLFRKDGCTGIDPCGLCESSKPASVSDQA